MGKGNFVPKANVEENQTNEPNADAIEKAINEFYARIQEAMDMCRDKYVGSNILNGLSEFSQCDKLIREINTNVIGATAALCKALGVKPRDNNHNIGREHGE